MSRCFAYIRVSTTKQKDEGVSLDAQREAIEHYARRNDLGICRWFEESKTAAKQGRPEFAKMIRLLRQRKADGVIVHKIDRSARNLRDWSDFAELTDQGIQIHLAADALDLSSRGGRLSADIQAVIAADYIRNLRDEARKGFYGRLKQGLLPVRAPLGYLDNGGGKVKTVDPAKGPLITEMFERYATGRYSLESLAATMNARGLRNTVGKPLNDNAASRILNNRFYTGLIEVRTTREIFEGVHESIVTTALFDQVQDVLHGKAQIKQHRHSYIFRRLLSCGLCSTTLIGERQKGHIYYRCHTTDCATKCTREEVIDDALLDELELIALDSDTRQSCESALESMTRAQRAAGRQDLDTLRTEDIQVKDRLGRLTDLLVDGHIDPASFEDKKRQLLTQKAALRDRIREARENPGWLHDKIATYLELAATAPLTYEMASPTRKRQIVETVTSNRMVSGREVSVELRTAFRVLADRHAVPHCGQPRDLPRTWKSVVERAFKLDLAERADVGTYVVAGLAYAAKVSESEEED